MMIDQPQTTVSNPGVLSVIHLATRTRIGPRIERIIRRAQKSVAGLASYGGSCVLSPAGRDGRFQSRDLESVVVSSEDRWGK